MSTKLNFGRDIQGYNAFAPAPATDIYTVTLSNGGSSRFQIPSNFTNWIASFSYQPASDIWVAYGGSSVTAAPPGGSSFASATSELNPGSRSLQGGTYISCYNNGSANADVCVVLYAVS